MYIRLMIDSNKFFKIDGSIRFGKLCIAYKRIFIEDIFKWLPSSLTFKDIERDFLLIKREHIFASLSFAANREESLCVVYK